MTALLEYLDLLQIQTTQNRIYGCSTYQGWSLWYLDGAGPLFSYWGTAMLSSNV